MAMFAETDDGYVGYVEKSHDPGYSLIFATILFCIISYCSLPFLVALGNRLDVKNQRMSSSKRQRRQRGRKQVKSRKFRESLPEDNNDDDKREESNNNNNNASEYDTADPIFEVTEGPPLVDMSVVSARSTISIAPSLSSITSLHSHRTRKKRNQKRNKRTMEKRHGWEEFELRMQRYDLYVGDDDKDNEKTTPTKIATDNNSIAKVVTPKQQTPGRDLSPERSVMGPLDQDAVSMDDAVSNAAGSPTRKVFSPHPPNMTNNALHNIATAAGYPDVPDEAFHTSIWNTILDLVTWDFECKRIIKLAIPFATQALSTGILDSITVALIGKVLGTKEVSAFVTVRALIDVSSSFFGGYHESIATLCSQAMGRHNFKLVGHYVQLSVIFYVVSYIPFIILWWVYMPSILSWFGFDSETVEIGQAYNQVYLLLELLDGVDESIHGLLDVIDLESYSTLVGVSQELVTFLDILAAILLAKPSLYVIGLIELFVAIIFLGINIATIIWRGWFEPYREGLVGSCAFYNKSAVRLMLSTASSLSVGYLLTDGEWEILTLFAKYLGPAEVAAWGILGVLWESIERLTEAVADASEVRCAFLLGSGQPAKAKRSAYKSMFIGFFLSLFLTSIVFMLGEDLATWFTNDPALQHIIADLLPLFGIGNVTLTIGTICWTLLGSQGRYRLATCVAAVASWFVTLPLAALFTFQLQINLQGQTAAIVIGYMVSGTLNAYFLFRSDWLALSKAVQKANENEVAPPDWDFPPASGGHTSKPSTPDTDNSGKDSAHDILASPTLGALGTLVEGNVGEESFMSAGSEEYYVTPDATPEKEIV